MFDENVEELTLTDTNVSFSVKCPHQAAYIAYSLAWNAVPFHVDSKITETANEWRYLVPRFALGILRTI